jgi:hypothetical protein
LGTKKVSRSGILHPCGSRQPGRRFSRRGVVLPPGSQLFGHSVVVTLAVCAAVTAAASSQARGATAAAQPLRSGASDQNPGAACGTEAARFAGASGFKVPESQP